MENGCMHILVLRGVYGALAYTHVYIYIYIYIYIYRYKHIHAIMVVVVCICLCHDCCLFLIVFVGVVF